MIYEARVVAVIRHKVALGITCMKLTARPIFLPREDMLKVKFLLIIP